MIGIRFKAYQKPSVMLGEMFSHPRLDAYVWNISEYIPMYGSGIREGVYSSSEAVKCAAALPADEPAEYYCVFGAREMDGGCEKVPETFADYLEGSYEMAFVCTDICMFDLYCKDEGVLRDVAKALVEHGVCAERDIEEYTLETNGRTGFYW